MQGITLLEGCKYCQPISQDLEILKESKVDYTILSIIQTGFAASGCVDTQLSIAYPPFEVEPPQASTPSGSV
jgi:hypothetical protein